MVRSCSTLDSPTPSHRASNPRTYPLTPADIFAPDRVGDLRLRAPRPVSPYTEAVNATTFGNQCIQQTFPNIPLPDDVPEAAGEYLSAFFIPAPVPQSEDCTSHAFLVR